MKQKIFNELKSLIECLVIAAVLVFLFLHFIAMSCVVDGTSMYPTLIDQERGFSSIISRKISLERFDIVVIQSDQVDYLLVKRIVGLPGEKIQYIDGDLYVNGKRVAEDFLPSSTYTEDVEITLGEDEYYCLGDNRLVSRDSRFYGPFTGDEIIAKGFFTVYPFTEWGIKK